MDLKDLDRIFKLTAAISLIVAFAALPFDPTWALRFTSIALFSWFSFYALSKAIIGLSTPHLPSLIFGIMLKPLCLVYLLIVIQKIGLEITSFLAGLNMFFACVFLNIMIRRFFVQSSVAAPLPGKS